MSIRISRKSKSMMRSPGLASLGNEPKRNNLLVQTSSYNCYNLTSIIYIYKRLRQFNKLTLNRPLPVVGHLLQVLGLFLSLSLRAFESPSVSKTATTLALTFMIYVTSHLRLQGVCKLWYCHITPERKRKIDYDNRTTPRLDKTHCL